MQPDCAGSSGAPAPVALPPRHTCARAPLQHKVRSRTQARYATSLAACNALLVLDHCVHGLGVLTLGDARRAHWPTRTGHACFHGSARDHECRCHGTCSTRGRHHAATSVPVSVQRVRSLRRGWRSRGACGCAALPTPCRASHNKLSPCRTIPLSTHLRDAARAGGPRG